MYLDIVRSGLIDRYKNNDDNYKTLINNLDNVIVAKYNAVKSEVDAFEFNEQVFKEWVGMNPVYENWTTAEERIYSVGGQMMKAVKKGINIIVGDDNKSKKVVNK